MKKALFLVAAFGIFAALIVSGCGDVLGTKKDTNDVTYGQNSVVVGQTAASLSECPNNGVKIEAGIDRNSNGKLDADEVDATKTQFVCNGTTGAAGTAGTNGKTPLVDVVAEAAGANCAFGGWAIKVGPDVNTPTVVTSTKYICNGATAGTIKGAVTTAVGGAALEGVAVTTTPTVAGATATTDANGGYTLTVPGGAYTVTFTKAKYTTGTATVNVANGVESPLNLTMAVAASGNPTVALAASANNVGYDKSFTVTATATSNTGGALTYTWTNATGSGNTATGTSQTFASSMAGKAAPATDPGGYVTAYTQEDRIGVLPILADTRGAKAVSVKVTDGKGGSTTASVTVNSSAVQTGLRQVPVGVAAFMNSGSTSATLSLTGKPSGSTAALSTAGTGTRNPWFVPDVEGKYTITSSTGATIDVYAGKYVGALSGGGYTSKTVTKANGMWYSWAPSSTESSMTYTNWPTVTKSSGCACHNGTAAPDNFTPWAQTVHGTFFARGVENITSNGANCVTCHTAGGSGGTGGYADVAASTTGYKYPAKATGAWAKLVADYPAVAKVSNIQCENCHGPQSTANDTGHMSTASKPTATTAVRVSYSADVCGTCHGSGTGHHRWSEWKTTGHADTDITIPRGNNPHCGRCHSAQGFVKYLAKLNAGSTTLSAADIDWNSTNAQPVTCAACHDPHSAANDHQLRLTGSTPMLPSGYKAIGLGRGALCVACHNTRNGLHEDGTNPTGYSAPHTASQGDVFVGRNAYFMGADLPMISKHANIEDSCVACHMVLNPQTHLSHGAPAPNDHRMRIESADRMKVCVNCHHETGGEALVESVEALLVDLEKKMGDAAKAKINAVSGGIINVRAYDEHTDLYSSSSSTNYNVQVNVATNPVTHVGIVEGHGQIEFHIVLTSAITITWSDGSQTTTNEFGVQLGALMDNQATPVAVYAMTSNMVKAGWNYFLIEGDDSFGIHNPTFALEVLKKTLAQDLTI